MSGSVNLGEFDVNGLYILLSLMPEEDAYHWGFYLAVNNPLPNNPMNDGRVLGISMHVTKTPTNDPATNNKWRYEQKERSGTTRSKTVIVALKIAVLDPVLHQPLGDHLSRIPLQHSTIFHEASSCRVWLKDALYSLDQHGFIKLKTSVEEIEEEGFDAVCGYKTNRQVQILNSERSDA